MSISLAQYLLYLKYFALATLLITSFSFIYMLITPVREIKLIKEGNVACAWSFGGALIGFCITIASSITHSLNTLDFMIWGLAAMVIQLIVYFAASHIIGKANQELAADNRAVGLFFASLSISIGLINAACLT